MKSILRYLGAKDIDLTEYGIEQYKTYCEPFSGSFNTGIKLAESKYTGKIIYNDLDKEVYNFWDSLVENTDKVYNNYVKLNKEILNTLDNIQAEEILKKHSQSEDKFERASAEYIYRLCLTMKGLKVSGRLTEKTELIDMYLTAELFKQQKIEINNLDYKDIIKKINKPDTFLLVDPPYINCKSAKNYRCDSLNFNHIELFKILNNFKGVWLLTYNNDPIIKDLYSEYNIKEIKRNLFGRDYIELYITNK